MNILCGLNLLIPVINYYETRYDYLSETKQSKKYIYNATVHSWDKIQVINTKLENSIEGNSISVVDSNGTILRQYGNKETLYAYYNGSGYRHINASETNFSLPKSYVVEMNLQYEEAKGQGELAGFVTHVTQNIIIDEHYQPRLLVTYSSNAVS